MGDSLGASLADLKQGIVDAKTAAMETGNISTDAQDPEGIIDQLATDLTTAIHTYTKTAQVVTKSDIASGVASTDAATDMGSTTQEDGGANSRPADSQGGSSKGLTELDDGVLYDGIKDAYLSMMEAAKTEVQDPDMSQADKDAAIEALIHSTLADIFCTAVKDYVVTAVVKTDVTVEGGVALLGGIHTSLSAASQSASGVDTPAIGATDEYEDATGEGTVS